MILPAKYNIINTMKILIFVLGAIMLFSCSSPNLIKKYSASKEPSPPGTVQIAENLYFDGSEISNISYLEYLYWLARIYGNESEKYNSMLPDTLVWLDSISTWEHFTDIYLRHPAYHDYPSVGTSFEQAEAYSKWRSNVVFQNLLIKEKKIPAIFDVKDSFFTVEKYFKGQYYGIKPDLNQPYPSYYLPDSTTFYKVAIFAEKYNRAKNRFRSKKYVKSSPLLNFICEKYYYNRAPIPVFPSRNSKIIANLKGNIREMTNVKGQVYGGCYLDNSDAVYDRILYDQKTPNSYTGFRNACKFVKWEE